MYELILSAFITIGGAFALILFFKYSKGRKRNEQELLENIKLNLNLEHSRPQQGYIEWEIKEGKKVSIPVVDVVLYNISPAQKNELETFLMNRGFALDLKNMSKDYNVLAYKHQNFICKLEFIEDNYEKTINDWLYEDERLDVCLKLGRI